MTVFSSINRWHAFLAQALDALRSPVLLGTRLWVSWQFLVSGWIKLTTWDTTLLLFREEYHVPLLPPDIAAVAGTCGELLFPAALVIGLFSRFAALGLFAVNSMALISYWHVLGGDDFAAARGQHYLWGFMTVVIATCGAGAFSVDGWLERRRQSRPLMA